MSEFSSAANGNAPSIYDKSLLRPRGAVALSTFSFIFSEMVQYFQLRSNSVEDLERKLEEAGFGIGQRMSELVAVREKLTRRETRIESMLFFVQNTIWKHLFNKEADNLEKSNDDDDEYMIYENSPITNIFVSVPDDMGSFNCAAFLAGIISGILVASNFDAKVTAHTLSGEGGSADRTVFLVKFSQEVMGRPGTL